MFLNAIGKFDYLLISFSVRIGCNDRVSKGEFSKQNNEAMHWGESEGTTVKGKNNERRKRSIKRRPNARTRFHDVMKREKAAITGGYFAAFWKHFMTL